MKSLIYEISDIHKIAKDVIKNSTSKTLCFYGDMGAGKTTLIKAIVKELGVSNETSSPTFSIVNEYYSDSEELIAYHFDFYRLNNEEEALDLGLEDYLYANCWTFIEWPEKIKSYLPQQTTNIHITVLENSSREIIIINKK